MSSIRYWYKSRSPNMRTAIVTGLFILVAGSIAAMIQGYFTVRAANIQAGRASPTDSQQSIPSPSSPPTSEPVETIVPTPSTAGRATIRVTSNRPGGCSSTYLVEGEVLEPPAEGNTLWLVSVLHADPANGLDHALYFAKQPIEMQLGPYRLELQVNPQPGVRRGRHIIVTADQEAHAQLQLNAESNRFGDDRYPDRRRVRLPAGSEQIASSLESEQRC